MTSCLRTQRWPFCDHLTFEANWKGEKLDKWVLHELTANKKKKLVFWSVAFSYSVQQQWIISQSDCDVWWKVDFIWPPVATSSLIGPRRTSKSLPKAKLAPKKGHGHCFWSAALLIHYSFLNPGETIVSENYAQQINEMHWKLQCLQLALVNRMGPILHDNAWLHVAQPTLQKLNELGYKALPHPPYSLDLSPVNYRRRQWHPTPVLLSGKSHGRRSLVGCSPGGR